MKSRSGLVTSIKNVLVEHGPQRSRQIAEKIELPVGWTFERLQKNVAVLLCQCGKDRWIQMSRGVYAAVDGDGRVIEPTKDPQSAKAIMP